MRGVGLAIAALIVFSGIADADEAALYECRWATGPIEIDGRADEAAWKAAQVIDRFTLPRGDRREVVGLPTFDACVAQDDVARDPDCRVAAPLTTANR